MNGLRTPGNPTKVYVQFARDHLRIGEDLVDGVDRSGGNSCGCAPRQQIGGVAPGGFGGDDRVDLGTVGQPRLVGGEARLAQ